VDLEGFLMVDCGYGCHGSCSGCGSSRRRRGTHSGRHSERQNEVYREWLKLILRPLGLTELLHQSIPPNGCCRREK
jgi:hypothetical protein